MLPDEEEDLCRDMEGLSITELSMLPDEEEDLCRDMEGLSIMDLLMLLDDGRIYVGVWMG